MKTATRSNFEPLFRICSTSLIATAVLLGAPKNAPAQQLYVVIETNAHISEFHAKTGGTENPSFISGLDGPADVTVNGDDLYVCNENNGVIGKYNASTGEPINASLITLPTSFWGIAIKD
jgi:hypothetical protein